MKESKYRFILVRSFKLMAVVSILTNFMFSSCAQKFNWKKLAEKGTEIITDDSGKSLTNGEIIEGLKEALTVGTRNSSSDASKEDGFFKNPKIKIPFPPEAVKMENKLRKIGMGAQVDKFVLTLNRAAEEAAKGASQVFIKAVKEMTIGDGLAILKGADNAATQYLHDKTYDELKNRFQPVVHEALQKVEVTKYWEPLIKAYNKLPFVEKMNPDIEDYATEKSLDGLFFLLAKEELKIRKDPLARVSDILKKVFG